MTKFNCIFAGVLLCILFSGVAVKAQGRRIENFGKDWSFFQGDYPGAQNGIKDDTMWRHVNLPHDWSIEGRFDENSPATTGGGALTGGIGWYSKSFELPALKNGENVFIDFDGVYMKAQVWINGHYLGIRPYGFSSFRYDLTAYLKPGSNYIAVKADNSQQPNSRWYSGSGIYRNVWLTTTGSIYVDHWGSSITTRDISSTSATVDLRLTVHTGRRDNKKIVATTTIYNSDGKELVSGSVTLPSGSDTLVSAGQALKVINPKLWSDIHPNLYKAITRITADGKLTDTYSANFGIRFFEFSVEKGFLLNGKRVEIKGVCDHHDLGCLGAAINTRALERQLEILKRMGCNGIRTSHNPPAPELLDLCDKMGFIVMDEAFDMWKKEKNPFDYHLYWNEWHKKDLQDLVYRDRNHPSVFIWSIGNEIIEQGDSTGTTIAAELAKIIRDIDTTRPITSALNNPNPSNYIYRSGALDLVGYNYDHRSFGGFPQRFPGKKFIGTETVSALETRGHYDMPSDSIRRWPTADDYTTAAVMNKDLTVSAYDNISTPWGSTHEETWKQLKKYDFLSGMYIWTGFDYIGEPTPYTWPARSSYFGIIDLAGFPKDVYYMYQSEWTDKPVLHLFPHWNWKEGQVVDLWAYYSKADEVELFLNGKSLGIRKKSGDELHVMWRVTFHAGTLKAVSRRNGKIVLEQQIQTAGPAARIRVDADRRTIHADGRDLSFLTVTVTDANGNTVPDADNEIKFSISGPARVAGVDNGNETSMESFKADHHQAFNGLCLGVIQSGGKKGNIAIAVTSPGLQQAMMVIDAR